MIDYERHARQIALAELGPEGQQALSERPVDLGALPPLAAALHRRAGGVTDASSSIRVTVASASSAPAWTLGASAWACVEAARRVLGEAPRAMPEALSARLGGRGG